ncbi:uncharacterized protein CLAFUR5_07183 [Fulvia fulva]|uniref:JmjC domain-containing protein n=1 Tax=Passalora fulva TaxID=5499 RepID=A0A9Q8URB6_PASFU|nr:uncharacterized protein CLAFUR5_07183 [Fulvia fulva]KAK4622728.1 hypothetical protein CLAFUR0_07053 [Fulvia fulva]UJO19542.1 hypothetical protein CLAFUR5_07183 [Fulvia fulva]
MIAGTEVWQENSRISFAPAQWVAWTKQILQGEQVLARVLNMPMGHMMPAERSQEYRHRAAEVAVRHERNLDANKTRQNQSTANITPRGTRTEVHHDSDHHISTARGLASRKRIPLKLWLLWPSTELRHLVTCYSDTKAALARMEYGSFFVQMPGESVLVPPNCPHAVVTLDSCYLYGHTFSTHSWAYDPTTALVEISVGNPVDEACQELIKRLRLGLRSGKFRQVYIDQFIETWAIEAPILRSQRDEFEKLIALWTEDIRSTGSCIWCAAAGGPGRYDIGLDNLEHMRAHLEGRTPLRGKDIVLEAQ